MKQKHKTKLRIADQVIVRSGDCKGEIGKIIAIKGDSVLIDGINMMQKHVKPNPQKNEQGGIVSKEKPINISNIAIYNQDRQRADKIVILQENGLKMRVHKSDKTKCGGL